MGIHMMAIDDNDLEVLHYALSLVPEVQGILTDEQVNIAVQLQLRLKEAYMAWNENIEGDAK